MRKPNLTSNTGACRLAYAIISRNLTFIFQLRLVLSCFTLKVWTNRPFLDESALDFCGGDGGFDSSKRVKAGTGKTNKAKNV